MALVLDIARTGVDSLWLHPLRTFATMACVIAVLVPYLAGMAISLGVQRDAELSAEMGADLFLSASSFGRPAPLPLSSLDEIRKLGGVESVVPRIIGPVTLGRENVNTVVVGLPAPSLPANVHWIHGRLFQADFEFVVGSALASRLDLALEDRVLPFYRSSQGERTGKVVGIFQSGGGLWESNVMFMSLETAAAIFDRPGQATDFAIFCRPGYSEAVSRQILRTVTFPSQSDSPLQPRIVSREQLIAQLPQGMRHRGGLFNLHFLVAFAVAILVVLVTSGIGLAERRREISILKAIGWETDELLVRSLVESLLLSLSSAAAAIVIAYVWLRWLNGALIANVLLPDWHWRLDAPVPFVLTPWPAFWSLAVSFVVVMCGSLYSTWRAACVPPLAGLK